MRVEWKGGPLDGAVQNILKPSHHWTGPDPSDPANKIVVYTLRGEGYVYDQEATERVNRPPAI